MQGHGAGGQSSSKRSSHDGPSCSPLSRCLVCSIDACDVSDQFIQWIQAAHVIEIGEFVQGF